MSDTELCYRDVVRLTDYNDRHVNAYAHFISYAEGGIIVSNSNMPFQGTYMSDFVADGHWAVRDSK
jgi:hypothetical protein